MTEESNQPVQKNESREELRKRLKSKIKDKQSSRINGLTKKKGENINESLKKIGDILANKNIQSPDQIDQTLIESIMTAISKQDLELVLNKMQENSKFKEILEQVKSKMTN